MQPYERRADDLTTISSETSFTKPEKSFLSIMNKKESFEI
jgi:hypothetical protein